MEGGRNSILIAIGVVSTAAILGSAISPVSTVQIFGFSSVVCVSLLGLLQQLKNAEKLVEAALNVQEVKETLVKTTEQNKDAMHGLKATTDAIHTLTNSNMGLPTKDCRIYRKA